MSNDGTKVIYSMMGVAKFYEKKAVLKDISLSYFYGAKIGVLGLNGSGKSSLLRIMAGIDKDFIGSTIHSPGYSIGYLEQEPKLDGAKTVRQIVEQGVQETVDLLHEFNLINERFAEPMSDDEMAALCDRQAAVQERLDRLDAWDLDSRLEMAMDALRCPPGETSVQFLSGGEKRRVALCRLLLQKPDILLLDEPTNHLDLEMIEWLEEYLSKTSLTLLMVTHDRYFLDRVCDEVIEMENAAVYRYKGNYTYFLEKQAERIGNQNKEVERAQNLMRTEQEWMRRMPKARTTKAKARIDSFYELQEK
ncbi:MAG: ATP-binding cassette domain-containing protein, partial [Deltaproteobacteria bacterium]